MAEDVSKLVEKWRLSKDFRQSYDEKWDRFYKIYNSYVDESKYKKRQSKLFVPFVYSIIEAILARLMNWCFSVEPVVRVLPMGKEDVDKAEKMDKLIQYQLRRRKFYLIALTWFKETLIYGTGVVKIFWDRDKNMPAIIPIDLRNFYPDPKGNYINYKWCFHRVIRDLDYLKRMQKEGYYKNIDQVEAGMNVETPTKERLELIKMGSTEYTQEELKNAVEILEYWEDDRVVTIANREVIIREDRNPFFHGEKPFVHIINIPIPHEFFGKGEVEPLERLQHELNAKRNQRIDIVNLVMNPVLKLIRGKGVNLDDLQNIGPGAVIRMNEDAVFPLNIPDVKASAYNEEEMVKRDMQDASGMYDYARGATPVRRETATAITSLQEMANQRFQERLKLIIEMGILEVVRKMVALNQQYMTVPTLIPIVGKGKGVDFMEVTPEDIQGQFDFIIKTPLTSPEVSKGVERRQLIELLGVLTNAQQFVPGINMREILVKICEAFGWKDIDKIIPPLPKNTGAGASRLGAPFQPGQSPIRGGAPPLRGEEQMTAAAAMKREAARSMTP